MRACVRACVHVSVRVCVFMCMYLCVVCACVCWCVCVARACVCMYYVSVPARLHVYACVLLRQLSTII